MSSNEKRWLNWMRVFVLLAVLKVVIGIGGFLISPPSVYRGPRISPPVAISVLNAGVVAAAAAMLLIGGRRDARAVHLGLFFLVVATSFAERGIPRFVSSAPVRLRPILVVLDGLQLSAFMPLFFWLFVRDFPASPPNTTLVRLLRFGVRASGAVGLTLFLVNLPVPPIRALAIPAARFAIVSRGGSAQESLYFPILLGLVALALPVAAWKARRARPTERYRTGVFVAALAIGLVPVSLQILLEALIPSYYRRMQQPSVRGVYNWIIYPLFLVCPLGTAYSVLVDRVLDVRFIIRKAMQYACTRYAAAVVVALPFIALNVYLYLHRAETVSGLVVGAGPWMVVTIAAGMFALRLRHGVFDAIDRRFFREYLDARRTLEGLVRTASHAATTAALGDVLRTHIDQALHIEPIALLIRDQARDMLVAVDGSARSLAATSALSMLLTGAPEPLDIDLDQPRSPLRRLPHADRQWLADGAFRLLVPILASGGTLIGVVALGEKKSELPFHADDRALLGAIAVSAGLVLEHRLLRHAETSELATRRAADQEPARECAICQTVYRPGTPHCLACGGELIDAVVPYMLAGKFRLEQRIGTGGMGVVYRASDLMLGREVAIKTLPRISPEHAMRLRREARATARVLHPNLAVIFGAESWHGTPLLVFEYLDGGTLWDRLRRTPLTLDEVFRLGTVLCDALQHAHDAGVIHGDIKPSNIGFKRFGTAKLLDFGVARMLEESGITKTMPESNADRPSHVTTNVDESVTADATSTAGLVGTIAYMSPEVLRGATGDASRDLWSLALVLVEALLGRNPYLGQTTDETVRLIQAAQP